MINKVKIVDMVMGSGKSSAAINYMNSHPDEKFLYITPFLDEVNRIISKCNVNKFYTPDENKFGTKLRSLKYLMSRGCNVASTHALFHYLEPDIADICINQEYTLIMDEVTDVVEEYDISKYDRDDLLNNYVKINDKTGLVEWREECSDYHGEFDEIKRLCEMHCLGYYGESMMIWLFPFDVFDMFKNIYILTYMFDSQIQKYYYDFFGMEMEYLYVKGDSVDNFEFTSEPTKTVNKQNYKELINVINHEKLNKIGNGKFDLSKTWYNRHSEDMLMNQLKNNTRNFFLNICKTPTKYNLWTTFKNYKHEVIGKGYTKGYESMNCRATNKHREKTSIAYLINRYLNTVVKQFFLDKQIKIDEDRYALSEMLQFIWRSAIRDGKPINVYIPSKRMRDLLIQWIDENSEVQK